MATRAERILEKAKQITYEEGAEKRAGEVADRLFWCENDVLPIFEELQQLLDYSGIEINNSKCILSFNRNPLGYYYFIEVSLSSGELKVNGDKIVGRDGDLDDLIAEALAHPLFCPG